MMAHGNRARWIALLCAGALAACSGDDSASGSAGPGTTTSTGGGGGAGGSSSSGGGQAPLACEPGGHGNVPFGECDLLQQDCPPGQTCQPFQSFNGAWNTKCSGGTGLKGPGKECLEQGECAEGLFCIGGSEDTPSICSPVCCQDTNEPCGGGQCLANVPYGPYHVLFCAYDPVCQLFDPAACEGNTQCHIADPDTGLATCTPPASPQSDEGGPCEYINSCKNMQECYSGNVCRYYCLLEPPGPLPPGEGGCPAGQTCNPANFGISGVGICLPTP